ncbi:kinase-like domain-containing protein [Rhizophagus irregularis DAOM 181602=DAOM 197198]|nr:kinase-like domain-containing protein [Rhizophagus irregularis DAOM 181602=DAOM 197198]
MNKENETKVTIEFVSKNLNVSDKDCNSAMTINHKKCSQCDKPFIEESWCKECDPFRMIEGWTSENHDIDEFIKNTIYDEALNYYGNYYPEFLEWVSFDRFEDIKKIGEGGFAKVYSATWIDGRAKYKRQDDEGWKKLDPEPMKVALKNLNGSQSMSAEYLNELQTHWNLNKSLKSSLKFYGMTKDPATKEFMMILQFAEKGNLKCFLSSNFSNFLWKDKIVYLCGLADDLNSLHKLGFFYRDLHSGNILQNISGGAFVSDFGLSGSPNEQKSSYRCMDANPDQRPAADELLDILAVWDGCTRRNENQEEEKIGYKRKQIKAMFEEADKEIPNISTSYEKNSDAIYTSRKIITIVKILKYLTWRFLIKR